MTSFCFLNVDDRLSDETVGRWCIAELDFLYFVLLVVVIVARTDDKLFIKDWKQNWIEDFEGEDGDVCLIRACAASICDINRVSLGPILCFSNEMEIQVIFVSS